jgi:hypothetical protein
VKNIANDKISEEDFVEKAVAAVGEVKKTNKKLIAKSSLMQVLRYTGDLTKIKQRQIKLKA